ncbi:hypothetical protein MRX96_025761 [Rhipicephalus microplus]
MTVPLTHFLLLTQVIYCSIANAHHRDGSANTERHTSATTLFRAKDRGQNDDCGVCPATHFGQCQLPINEPWADESFVYQVQKPDCISTATGREASINMTVPLTHFLLLTQVIYCSTANVHYRNGSASTERHTSATTLFSAEDQGQDDDCGFCPATQFGQCQLPINEPWEDGGRVYQVQKQDWISTATGREAGINMTMPLTHFLLLTQVIYCSAANAHHRNGSASTERHTSRLHYSEPRTESRMTIVVCARLPK